MANPFFNASYNLGNNPDLYLNGVTLETAEAHYLQYGAQEYAAGAPDRDGRPNPWFDASFYLLSNPDLVAAGLTVADALNHYATYGVNEGRNPSATLDVADFTAKEYADNNTDVRDALGITDTSALTPEQTSQLLSHYLAYGYIEGREDAGIDVSVPAIPVPANETTYGTMADDTFAWDGAAAGASIFGLGGTDTLKADLSGADGTITLNSVENIIVTDTSVSASTLTVLGSGVQAITVKTGDNDFTYNGAKVDTFNLTSNADITAQFTAATVVGTNDTLAVNLAGNAATALPPIAALTVNGIETINVNLGTSDAGTARGLTLDANSVQGDTLMVTVAGGKADTDSILDSIIILNSTASPNLANVTLDGSAGVGDQSLSVDSTLSLVNATVTGGSGDDWLATLTAAGHTATLDGGAGDDYLVASKGQDTMTGGSGENLFYFDLADAKAVFTGAGAAATITAVDTITDHSFGDVIKLAGAMQLGGIDGVGVVDGKGVLAFETGYLGSSKTLTSIITDLSEGVGLEAGVDAGKKVIFQFEEDTYVYANTDAAGITGDALIKLTGVDSTELTGTAIPDSINYTLAII